MGCGTCSPPKKNNPFDKRGNKKSSLDKYAFLNPNQLAIKKAQEEKDKEETE